MTGRRLATVLGASACLAAAVLSAVAAGLRSFDRALSDLTVDTAFVPVSWADAFFEENQ